MKPQLSFGSGELMQDGSHVLLIEKNFVGYFYAIAQEGFDSAATAKKILEANPDSIAKVGTS